MSRIFSMTLLALCVGILACDQQQERVQESSPTPVASKPRPSPLSKRPVRSGPPDFSNVEQELIRYIARYEKMTELQEQAASSGEGTPPDDFGPKLVGRNYRFTGRVNEVKRDQKNIIVDLSFIPREVKRSMMALRVDSQHANFSRHRSQERSDWQLVVLLPDDENTRRQATAWSKGTWLAFDGRVESADGFQLARDSGNAWLRANRQSVVIMSKGPVPGPFIGPGSRVVMLVDASGSMIDIFGDVRSAADAILDSLPANAHFGVDVVNDDTADGRFEGLSPVSASSLQAAKAMLDEARAEGQTDLSNAIENALASRPDFLICITDGDLDGGASKTMELLARHPDCRVVAILFTDQSISAEQWQSAGDIAVIEKISGFDSRARIEQGEGPYVRQIVEALGG